MPLTLESIRAAQSGDTVRDDSVPGLHLRTFPTRKSFYLYYRTKIGKERRPKLGDHPTLALNEARRIAKDMLAIVAAGGDPMGDYKAARAAPTVNDLIAKTKPLIGNKSRWRDEGARILDKYVAPRMGNLKVAEVGYQDIHDLHSRMETHPHQANRVLQVLSRMFNLAERFEMRPQGTNPTRHVQRFREPKRRRYWTPDEATAVAKLLDHYKDKYLEQVAFVFLLIWTGARPGEVARFEWSWLSGNKLWDPDGKTGERPIYLPEPAMAVINGLPRVSTTILNIQSPRNLWDRIRADIGTDLRLYDLRHSFASAALASGLSLPQIGELLGHKSTQTTKRYAHLADDMHHTAAAQTATVMDIMMGNPKKSAS